MIVKLSYKKFICMLIFSEEIVSNLIHTIFTICMLLNAFFFIPQAINLFKCKNPQGLSLSMFLGFNVSQVFTVLHGYLIEDYLLMIGFLLSFLTCSMVTCLIIFYRANKYKKPSSQKKKI